MQHTLQRLSLCVLCTTLILSLQSRSHAQFTYTFYPTDTTINSIVETDLAIVGFAGGSYDDNFNPNFTSPTSPTVNIVAGADISGGSNHGVGEMDIFNHSTVNVSGGNVYTITSQNSSTLNLLPGSTIGVALSFEQSVVNMNGGDVADLEGQGKQINVGGGTVGTLVANTNTDLFGTTLGSCLVNVTGGNITSEADAYNDGILNLYGGQFDGNLFARFGGTINVFGHDLRATLVNPNFNNTYSLYSLSGFLDNGTVLNDNSLFIENDGVTYGHSSFQLVNATPEPGSIALLLAFGACSVPVLIRKRTRTGRTRSFESSTKLKKHPAF